MQFVWAPSDRVFPPSLVKGGDVPWFHHEIGEGTTLSVRLLRTGNGCGRWTVIQRVSVNSSTTGAPPSDRTQNP
jgi:hypothetical protein